MTRAASITRPLMLALTGMLVIFWLLALALGVLVMRHELDEVFDSALQETAERLLALTIEDMDLRRQAGRTGTASLNTTSRREYLVYQVRDRSGRLIQKSDDAPSRILQQDMARGFSNTDRYRVFTSVSTDGALILQVADRYSNRREAVRESAVTMLIPLLFLIPANIVSILLVIRRALRPIGTLRQAIGTKDGGNLAPIDETRLPEELQPIAHSVNLLLERLRNAFAAEREFTANSAHELRTPIAGALAQTQRLVEELADKPERGRALKVEGALHGLGRLAEKLLQLARAESGLGNKDSEVDLLQVLDIVVHDADNSFGEGRDLTYRRSSDQTLVRRVDPDAFGIVMRNLIENALLHGDADQAVIVSIDSDHAISVVNACPVLSERDIMDFKRRFHRGRTSADGSGLGLAIADRLVTQMGGTLTLLSPASGRSDGFEARVDF